MVDFVALFVGEPPWGNVEEGEPLVGQFLYYLLELLGEGVGVWLFGVGEWRGVRLWRQKLFTLDVANGICCPL